MKVIKDLSQINIQGQTAVSIGKFDGLHIGHRRILRELKKAKRDLGKKTKSIIVMIVGKYANEIELLPINERILAFEKAGVDITVVLELSDDIKNITAESFLKDYIINKFGAKIIVCGPDVSFGKGAPKMAEFLKAHEDEYGYEARIIPKETYKGETVSSSRIREAIRNGEEYDAKVMLGGPLIPEGEGAILVINKPEGFTSFDVIAKLKGVLHTGKLGHTGTLDPMATGVLPVLIGKATKLCDELTAKQKTYETVMQLGITTDTQDTTGKVINERTVNVSEEDVKKVIKTFIGDIDQIPPMYSAIKIDGKKLCDLARSGKEVERKPRHIIIHDIEITEINLPFVSMKVNCGKGTYIRTLCHDIGEKLGCGAAMKSLKRTASGMFTLDEAISLDEAERLAEKGEITRHLISMEEVRRI